MKVLSECISLTYLHWYHQLPENDTAESESEDFEASIDHI